MYIPSHYVFLFVAIFLGESATIFVYTVIGLIKANPLPYFVTPIPEFPLCRYISGQQPFLTRSPPDFEPEQPQVIQSNVGQFSPTVTVYQVVNGMASNTKRVEGLLPTGVETMEVPNIASMLVPASGASSSEISAVASSILLTDSLMNGATSTTTATNTPLAVTSVVMLTTVASFTSSHPPRSTIFQTVVLPLPSSSAK